MQPLKPLYFEASPFSSSNTTHCMPCDRPLRNTHSSLPYPSVATRSCQPYLFSSSLRRNTAISSAPHIDPGRCGSQYPADVVGVVGDIAIQDLDTRFPVSQQPFAFENTLNPQPTISGLSHESSIPELLLPLPLSTCSTPPRHLLGDVVSTDIDLPPIDYSPDTLAEANAVPVSINQLPSSLFVNQGYQPRHFEEPHPIHYNLMVPRTMSQPSEPSSFPNLSTQSYPVLSESVNRFSLVDPSYYGYPPVLFLSQTEQAQFTQPYWMSERCEQRNVSCFHHFNPQMVSKNL